jgi:UDP-glucose 4-epimerase
VARCVVVGGNGFLGSSVVDELVRAGHQVTVFDRFSAAAIAYSSHEVRRVVGDFLDTSALRAALQEQDFLFHFLSTSTPAIADDDPSLDVRTNVSHSVTMFELAIEAGISRVYFASTGGAMYGTVGDDASEESLPAPVSPYAIGKLAIEGYLRYFKRKHGLESVSFRISNPYGPRQHLGKTQGVIPIFLQRVAAGLPLQVYGDGSMVRDYIYAEDAARMIVAVVDREPEFDIYNVGSGRGASINDLVALTASVSGVDAAVETVAQPSTFIDRVVLDVSRYSAEFGPPSLVSLEDGVAATWAALRGASG